jgi:hypothetical protein
VKFRKKPVIIEAIKLEWKNWSQICDFCGVGKFEDGNPEGFNPDGNTLKLGLRIPTLEGTMYAFEGDWIIKGVAGEFYPCKPAIFEATYEPVED